MAARRVKKLKAERKVEPEAPKVEAEVAGGEVKEEKKDDDVFGEKLDPAEEKVLDRILMVIVVFILAWLGLSILLVFRGYACSEWIKGGFICAGIS